MTSPGRRYGLPWRGAEVARAAEPQTIAGLTRTPSAPEPQEEPHPAYIQGRSFVAPRPVTPQQRAGTGARAEPEPLSSVRATQTREPPVKPRAPAPSLFQRIIGSGRQQPAPHRNPPNLGTPRPAAQAAQAPAPRQAALDAAEPAGGEEDYLDIPAFLRRQAN